MLSRHQLIRSSVTFALGLAILGVGAQASAYWVGTAKIVRVRSYASGTTVRFDIWFDKTVASGCSDNTKASIVSNNQALLDGIRSVAIAAQVSDSDVEVNTVGCEGQYGKIDYLSMK